MGRTTPGYAGIHSCSHSWPQNWQRQWSVYDRVVVPVLHFVVMVTRACAWATCRFFEWVEEGHCHSDPKSACCPNPSLGDTGCGSLRDSLTFLGSGIRDLLEGSWFRRGAHQLGATVVHVILAQRSASLADVAFPKLADRVAVGCRAPMHLFHDTSIPHVSSTHHLLGILR